jgi:hypothetical protein
MRIAFLSSRSVAGLMLACSLASAASGSSAFGQNPEQAKPVLVELFTSEGCSDCPPADRLLEQLDKSQPIPGAHAIVLSEHVTYWDHEGWRDPFSLDAMTARQKTYGFRFNLPDVYTPQMVVDGATQFVGNDPRALGAAMQGAVSRPKQEVAIENARWDNDAASFSVRSAAPSNARLVVALAADATHSDVARGENAGRTLHHVAVVRVMKELGPEAADGRTLSLAGGSIAAGPVRVVAFLVDRKSGHVLGVAEQTLTR